MERKSNIGAASPPPPLLSLQWRDINFLLFAVFRTLLLLWACSFTTFFLLGFQWTKGDAFTTHRRLHGWIEAPVLSGHLAADILFVLVGFLAGLRVFFIQRQSRRRTSKSDVGSLASLSHRMNREIDFRWLLIVLQQLLLGSPYITYISGSIFGIIIMAVAKSSVNTSTATAMMTPPASSSSLSSSSSSLPPSSSSLLTTSFLNSILIAPRWPGVKGFHALPVSASLSSFTATSNNNNDSNNNYTPSMIPQIFAALFGWSTEDPFDTQFAPHMWVISLVIRYQLYFAIAAWTSVRLCQLAAATEVVCTTCASRTCFITSHNAARGDREDQEDDDHEENNVSEEGEDEEADEGGGSGKRSRRRSRRRRERRSNKNDTDRTGSSSSRRNSRRDRDQLEGSLLPVTTRDATGTATTSSSGATNTPPLTTTTTITSRLNLVVSIATCGVCSAASPAATTPSPSARSSSSSSSGSDSGITSSSLSTPTTLRGRVSRILYSTTLYTRTSFWTFTRWIARIFVSQPEVTLQTLLYVATGYSLAWRILHAPILISNTIRYTPDAIGNAFYDAYFTRGSAHAFSFCVGLLAARRLASKIVFLRENVGAVSLLSSSAGAAAAVSSGRTATSPLLLLRYNYHHNNTTTSRNRSSSSSSSNTTSLVPIATFLGYRLLWGFSACIILLAYGYDISFWISQIRWSAMRRLCLALYIPVVSLHTAFFVYFSTRSPTVHKLLSFIVTECLNSNNQSRQPPTLSTTTEDNETNTDAAPTERRRRTDRGAVASLYPSILMRWPRLYAGIIFLQQKVFVPLSFGVLLGCDWISFHAGFIWSIFAPVGYLYLVLFPPQTSSSTSSSTGIIDKNSSDTKPFYILFTTSKILVLVVFPLCLAMSWMHVHLWEPKLRPLLLNSRYVTQCTDILTICGFRIGVGIVTLLPVRFREKLGPCLIWLAALAGSSSSSTPSVVESDNGEEERDEEVEEDTAEGRRRSRRRRTRTTVPRTDDGNGIVEVVEVEQSGLVTSEDIYLVSESTSTDASAVIQSSSLTSSAPAQQTLLVTSTSISPLGVAIPGTTPQILETTILTETDSWILGFEWQQQIAAQEKQTRRMAFQQEGKGSVRRRRGYHRNDDDNNDNNAGGDENVELRRMMEVEEEEIVVSYQGRSRIDEVRFDEQGNAKRMQEEEREEEQMSAPAPRTQREADIDDDGVIRVYDEEELEEEEQRKQSLEEEDDDDEEQQSQVEQMQYAEGQEGMQEKEGFEMNKDYEDEDDDDDDDDDGQDEYNQEEDDEEDEGGFGGLTRAEEQRAQTVADLIVKRIENEVKDAAAARAGSDETNDLTSTTANTTPNLLTTLLTSRNWKSRSASVAPLSTIFPASATPPAFDSAVMAVSYVRDTGTSAVAGTQSIASSVWDGVKRVFRTRADRLGGQSGTKADGSSMKWRRPSKMTGVADPPSDSSDSESDSKSDDSAEEIAKKGKKETLVAVVNVGEETTSSSVVASRGKEEGTMTASFTLTDPLQQAGLELAMQWAEGAKARDDMLVRVLQLVSDSLLAKSQQGQEIRVQENEEKE